MAEKKTIITIGRQYGSGGHEIGATIAQDLGIKLYDKEMLKRAAKESGLCEELFEMHDEKPTNSFLYSLILGLRSRFRLCATDRDRFTLTRTRVRSGTLTIYRETGFMTDTFIGVNIL